jgi:hypothetical protein
LASKILSDRNEPLAQRVLIGLKLSRRFAWLTPKSKRLARWSKTMPVIVLTSALWQMS